MKGLKKLAIASAVAAAPFAQAELVAMDDAVLQTMTGQSGVSIELSAEVSVGKFQYKDTDQGGTFEMSNIVLGGTGATGALDDIKIDIDVDSNDGLRIYLGAQNKPGVLGGTNPVDFGLAVGSVSINDTATLASNISIDGQLGPIEVLIANDSTISVDAYFEVTNGSMDIDVLGMGISRLTVGDNSNPFFSNLDSGIVSGGTANGVSVYNATLDGVVTGTTTYTDAADLYANGTSAEIEAVEATTAAQITASDDTFGQTYGATAGDGSGLSNAAWVNMTIDTQATNYVGIDGNPVLVGNSLAITINNMALDISADLTLGEVSTDGGATYNAASLGSIAIDDLDLSGTTLKIYGH